MKTKTDGLIEELRAWADNVAEDDLIDLLRRSADQLDLLQAANFKTGVELALAQEELEAVARERHPVFPGEERFG